MLTGSRESRQHQAQECQFPRFWLKCYLAYHRQQPCASLVFQQTPSWGVIFTLVSRFCARAEYGWIEVKISSTFKPGYSKQADKQAESPRERRLWSLSHECVVRGSICSVGARRGDGYP